MEETKPECIYIATRLTGPHPLDYLHNLDESIEAGIEVWNKGHYPFIPGWDFIFLMRTRDVGVQQIYNASIEWLLRCDAILVHNGYHDEPISDGVKAEVEAARKAGLKFYWSLDEIPEVTI